MEFLMLFLLSQVLTCDFVSCVSVSGLKKQAEPHNDNEKLSSGKTPHITKVDEGLYVGADYGPLNTVFLLAPQGLILVDVTDYSNSVSDFRKLHPDIPVKAIVYTQRDIYKQIYSQALQDAVRDSPRVEIYAWAIDPATDPMTIAAPAIYRRALRSGEITRRPQTKGGNRRDATNQYKTMFTENIIAVKDKNTDVNIAGMPVQLIQMSGPGDQLGVWIQSMRTFLCGGIFHPSFPSLYTVSGGEHRDPIEWSYALDQIRKLQPEILIPSRAELIRGKEEIIQILTDYRDSIHFVHGQTLRHMNKRLHPVDTARFLELPPHLNRQPHLSEQHCTLAWATRVMFDKYMGWFSGDIEDLFPHPPREEAVRLVRLAGGVERVLEETQTALLHTDYQWALELATSVLHVHREHPTASRFRRQALENLAVLQSSDDARNYYLNSAAGDDVNQPSPRNFALFLPVEQLLRLMSTWVRTSVCDKVNLQITILLTDIHRTFVLHLRNAIIEVREGTHAFAGLPDSMASQASKCEVSVSLENWRAILGQLESYDSLVTSREMTVIGRDTNCIKQLFSCLELMEPNYDYGF